MAARTLWLGCVETVTFSCVHRVGCVVQAARSARAEAEQGMKNAREMERDLRQQLANMEVEFSEQSGQLAAMMERIRRQEELTAAGTHPHPT